MAFNQELPWFVQSPLGEKIERSLLSSHCYIVSSCPAARHGSCWCGQFQSCDQCFGPVRRRKSFRCMMRFRPFFFKSATGASVNSQRYLKKDISDLGILNRVILYLAGFSPA
jgi:hypothetical protein